ncbi:MAG: hypothetical protein J6D03_09385 [Clostridia bacterium]|nr:hypothetical protein [Clostridia bacterium]
MSKNSFWNSLGDTIETVLFLRYGLPFLIVVITCLFGVAMINKWNVARQVDPNKTILYTEFEKKISEIAKSNVNTNEFDMEISDTDFHDIELEYTIKNKEYTADQYNNLLKDEITKVYNEIKDKELINDTLFGEDSGLNNVDIYFSLQYDEGYSNFLGGITLKYSIEDKWETGYVQAMNDIAAEQEDLNKLKVSN